MSCLPCYFHPSRMNLSEFLPSILVIVLFEYLSLSIPLFNEDKYLEVSQGLAQSEKYLKKLFEILNQNKIEFEILRNNKSIGKHIFFFKKLNYFFFMKMISY